MLRRLEAEAELARDSRRGEDAIAGLEAAIAGDQPVDLVDEGDVVIPFQISQKRMSYTSGSPERHYVLELTETESIDCTDLVIDSRSFGKPLGYYEKVDAIRTEQGDELKALVIDAKVRLTEADLGWLWNHKGRSDERYFQVVREGVSTDPVQMRYGRIIWDRKDDDLRASIILVEGTYDLDPDHRGPPPLQRPEQLQMHRRFLDLEEQMDRLLKLMAEKGVLTPDEASTVIEPDRDARWRRTLSLFEVDDIDEWDR